MILARLTSPFNRHPSAPLNMFYNTGIATYVSVPADRKPAEQREHGPAIDATRWLEPLRRNLGSKNCEPSSEDIQRIPSSAPCRHDMMSF